jgi:ribonuclease E
VLPARAASRKAQLESEPAPAAPQPEAAWIERGPEPAFESEESFSAAPKEALVERMEPAAEAEPEAAAGRRTRHRSGASKPRLERIVVGTADHDGPAPGTAPEEPSAPARKGWWQRRLSGE